jgi:peptide alpha-N-acetyltransferase
MQAQLKDYEGFAESRRRIMVLRPNIMQNWVTYFVAVFLAKNYDTALEVFDSIQTQIDESKERQLKPHEISEIYLFKAKIYEEMGKLKQAAKFLTGKRAEAAVLDDVAKYTILSRVYAKLGQTQKAVDCLEHMLKMNSSNKQIYLDILKARGVDLESKEPLSEDN